MRAFLIIAVLAGFTGGCNSAPKKSLAPRLEAFLGKQVTLVGIADPRKGGPAIHGEDFYVWLVDVDDWPANVAMKKVEVKGRLEEDHALPVFIDDPNNKLVIQGIPMPKGTDLKEASRRLILVHPTWRLVE